MAYSCYCLIRKHEFRNKPFSVGQTRTKERYDWSCVNILDESNTEPSGESAASSSASEESSVTGTTEELVSCEAPVNCSEGKNLEASLGKRGIDKGLQDEIEKEESHWKAALHSIVDVILHLAKQGSPLRGSNETLDFSYPRCDPSFKETRKRKKKRFFEEKCENESSEISQHKKFKLDLLQVNDRTEAELERQFQSMQKVKEIFGFLSPKQLTTLDNKILREKATTLANLYRDDLDKDELFVEIESFKHSVIGSYDLTENE
ncbi:hypothetical protein AVEN_28989-1 [Araneus ventricosus]|uniref:Uncharacterized protein n=1 Tax=Araneus ventricosus TaxID=182803 RepID=A0A4Y2AJP8_ARAVE|nr:hypothetical protein AVEN_28989-1 [Araneus ventricosus]